MVATQDDGGSVCCMSGVRPKTPGPGAVVMGRYQLADGPPLGTGGWCVVRRAADCRTGRQVAVKTYTSQAERELGPEKLADRFAREIRTFEHLGVGPSRSSISSSNSQVNDVIADPRNFLVNLLDYSTCADAGEPGCAVDGRYYTVLELADESLDVWLRKRLASGNHARIDELRQVTLACANGLAWLCSHGLTHLDVKPENIMRFGVHWKLIDLEGCLPHLEDAVATSVPTDSFTPLYASPELARLALCEIELLAPSGTMDTWALGVVLLDMLAHSCVFAETKAGFDSAALFEENAVPYEGWYRWLADEEPIDMADLITAPATSVEMLQSHSLLREFLGELLEKDSSRRLPPGNLLRHPFFSIQIDAPTPTPAHSTDTSTRVAQPCVQRGHAISQRAKIETALEGWGRGADGVVEQAEIYALVLLLGLSTFDARALLDAIDPTGAQVLTCKSFLDWVFAPGRPSGSA